jgi:hypothetical protein
MGVNVAFGPIEPPTKFYRLQQSALCKFKIDCGT